MLKLVTPEFDAAPAFADRQSDADADMHFRFEINFIVDEITGSAPMIKVLEYAWLEKRRYLRRFLLDYYASYRTLPRALHDLGTTHTHQQHIGTIDFAEIRARIRQRMERGPRTRPFWSRWFD